MARGKAPGGLSATGVTDAFFLEHRAKLIDIAAFLDRYERAAAEQTPAQEDFRMVQFKQALGLLSDRQPQRARRVLELFSDPTSEPLASANGMKGAVGAWADQAKQEVQS